MRLAAYAGTSALVAAGALLKAFHQRPNFYSATVYLSQSNACVLILANLALVGACSFFYGLQRLFYGPLRQVETDQLTEKAWYAVLDTLLAMPSLSHDIGGWMLAIFVVLLAGKVWGWIAEGRVDILEQQPPQNPRLFHARLASSLLLSILFDAFMLQYCIRTVRDNPRPGMMVIFTFEFAILSIFSLFTFTRYILALVEARILRQQTHQKIEERKAELRAERERAQQQHAESGDAADAAPAVPIDEEIDENEIDVPGWEDKRRWLFGLELATDFIKLLVYTLFFAISLTFMGLPMHIMRDVYLTFSAFAKRIHDYRNYRRATQNMNNRYPDANAQELSNDNTCIVCRELMTPWAPQEHAPPLPMNEGLRAKKLPCGHILHLRCLKAWLERQQACPTCRRPVISNEPLPGLTGQPHPEGAMLNPAQGGRAEAGQLGANHPAGPQPQQRQNRLRMINLGPIRIGVYNGPAHQVPEALAQRRNTHANQASAGSGAAGGNSTILGTASTQLQLMQVEERLLQDARNLAIEQTQLITVRALEAELARLRAVQDRNQHGRPPSQAGANPLQPIAQAPMQMPFGMPMHMPGPMQFGAPSFPQPLPQAFQPFPGQQPLSAESSSLPQGMSLPEGWTLTPLNRVGAMPQQGTVPRPSNNRHSTSQPPPPTRPIPSAMPVSAPTSTSFSPTSHETNGSETSAAIPSTTPAAIPSPSSSSDSLQPLNPAKPAAQDTAESNNEPPRPEESAPAAPQSLSGATSAAPAPAPWQTSSWSFAPVENLDQSGSPTAATAPNDTSADDGTTTTAAAAPAGNDSNGHVAEPEGSDGSRKDKGKGKAVTLEDVPDPES